MNLGATPGSIVCASKMHCNLILPTADPFHLLTLANCCVLQISYPGTCFLFFLMTLHLCTVHVDPDHSHNSVVLGSCSRHSDGCTVCLIQTTAVTAVCSDPAHGTPMAVCFIQTTAVRALCSEPAHGTPMAVCLIKTTAVRAFFSEPAHGTAMAVCLIHPTAMTALSSDPARGTLMVVCIIQPTDVTALCLNPAHNTPKAVCLICRPQP